MANLTDRERLAGWFNEVIDEDEANTPGERGVDALLEFLDDNHGDDIGTWPAALVHFAMSLEDVG